MLYIANPSLQRHQFNYREPVNNLINIVEIEAGSQTAIGQHWTSSQQVKVIEQLERFGARDAAEAHGKMGRFTGLIYRDMGQIEEAEIEMAHAAEMQTREERSVAAATTSALAFDRSARKQTRERPGARVTETSVREEAPPGTKLKRAEVDFGLTVDPEGRSDIALPV